MCESPNKRVKTTPEEFVQRLRAPPRDSIVNLNVGGRRYATLRSTLCKQKGVLQSMFDSKFSEHLKDEQDALFLDRHPEAFEAVLTYLRYGQVHVPGGVPAQLVQTEFDYFFYKPPSMHDMFTNGRELFKQTLAYKFLANKAPIMRNYIRQEWQVYKNKLDYDDITTSGSSDCRVENGYFSIESEDCPNFLKCSVQKTSIEKDADVFLDCYLTFDNLVRLKNEYCRYFDTVYSKIDACYGQELYDALSGKNTNIDSEDVNSVLGELFTDSIRIYSSASEFNESSGANKSAELVTSIKCVYLRVYYKAATFEKQQ